MFGNCYDLGYGQTKEDLAGSDLPISRSGRRELAQRQRIFSGGRRPSDAALSSSRAQSGHSGRGKPGLEIVGGPAGAPERLLDSYEAERRPNVREVIAITKMLGREICERDVAAAEERNRRLRADFENGNGIRVRQDLLPPLRNLLCDADRTRDTRPGEGEPFPQPWVLATGGRQRLDDVLGTGFRLILTGDFAADAQISRARAMGLSVATIGRARPAADFALADCDSILANWMAKRGCKGAL